MCITNIFSIFQNLKPVQHIASKKTAKGNDINCLVYLYRVFFGESLNPIIVNNFFLLLNTEKGPFKTSPEYTTPSPQTHSTASTVHASKNYVKNVFSKYEKKTKMKIQLPSHLSSETHFTLLKYIATELKIQANREFNTL